MTATAVLEATEGFEEGTACLSLKTGYAYDPAISFLASWKDNRKRQPGCLLADDIRNE